MRKTVNTLDFWKERIETATEERYSVYVTSPGDWSRLNEEHKKILDKEAMGLVLDAGCGYGRWAQHFDPQRYIGIDFSPDFIALAKKRFTNHLFFRCRMEEIPFPNNYFDSAFCVSIKEMIVENRGEKAWKDIERELKRVAKKVIILEYTNPDKYEVIVS